MATGDDRRADPAQLHHGPRGARAEPAHTWQVDAPRPRLGIVAWQSVSAALVAGAALAGLALLLSQVPLTTDLDIC